ncbi:flavin reductase family protein [Kerstersia similis]|uniref:flavin reductase family protein n=1 Tax=Kerstersia similis TaxID=206505 RepID=UPI0039EF842E
MTPNQPDFDSAHFRATLGRFATGVTVITTLQPDGKPVGVTISSFNSVSLTPPLVLWSLMQSSHLLPWFTNGQAYVINVLSHQQQDLAMRFARGPSETRYDGLPDLRTAAGTPWLGPDCAAWMECRPHSHHEAGDHVVLIGQVEHCAHGENAPLIYHRGNFNLTPVAGATA